MNSIWRQLAIATNWPVLVSVLLLSSVGVLTIWADTRNDITQEWQKQLIFLGVSFGALILFQAVDYRSIGRFSWTFYVVGLLLLFYTVLPFTHADKGNQTPFKVPNLNGAYAWINLVFFRFQPAELVKLSFVMVLSRYLRFRSNYRTLKGLMAPIGIAAAPLILILKQPDLGTALIFIPALFAMLFVAGAKVKHLMLFVGCGVILMPIGWLAGTDVPVFKHLPPLIRNYQRQRVLALFSNDPQTLQNTGMQQHKAEIAMGSGGFLGKGFGKVPIGAQVPEGHNDMIFSLVGEQFGFFGSCVILVAYIVLFTAGVEIAVATREPFGKLLAIGVVAMLAGQTFLNIMVTVKLMPVTGVTLPFMSYGGSSLLASFMSAGLLLNIGQNRPLVIANDAFEF